MKALVYMLLFVVGAPCLGQNNTKKRVSADTLFAVSLKNEYKVLQLCDLDSAGTQLKQTRRIEVSRANKKISSISLPIPDEEVKNFSVNEIKETQQGFKIAVAWGGGNYFYNRTFYFIFRNDRFYFTSLSGNNYTHEPEKETKVNRTINPPVSIDKLDIRKYIENE